MDDPFGTCKVTTTAADNCCVCGLSLSLEVSFIGHGDGTGQKFAHPSCHYRVRYKEAEARAEEAENKLRAMAALLDEYA